MGQRIRALCVASSTATRMASSSRRQSKSICRGPAPSSTRMPRRSQPTTPMRPSSPSISWTKWMPSALSGRRQPTFTECVCGRRTAPSEHLLALATAGEERPQVSTSWPWQRRYECHTTTRYKYHATACPPASHSHLPAPNLLHRPHTPTPTWDASEAHDAPYSRGRYPVPEAFHVWFLP